MLVFEAATATVSYCDFETISADVEVFLVLLAHSLDSEATIVQAL